MNAKSQTWFAVDVPVDPLASEAVEYAFNLSGALGTEINDFRKNNTDDICVIGYFDDEPDVPAIAASIEESLRIYGLTTDAVRTVAVRKVENADWLAEWKKHWKPTSIGKFIIAPPWADVDETADIVIRIEPNMAFGTGTHETTQLCLQAITDSYLEGQTFLDVGTGTGILAIAAAKMFNESQKIFACDTDADAFEIAKENALFNSVQIEFIDGPITKDTPISDFVCANLTIDVIVLLLPLLLTKTRHTLVLSGILVEQRDIISDELRKFQISNFKFEIKGEWISVVISLS
ncbi:MAG: 50S ribosomal protein L11 methyltransferase [Pyrinomonadaceae bacterium]